MGQEAVREKLEQISRLVNEVQVLLGGAGAQESLPLLKLTDEKKPGQVKIIEGIFDGQEMIGPDGTTYAVPANYASKSKLVEGDALKLTLNQDGSFVFKQVGPVTRDRLKGILTFDEGSHAYRVASGEYSYRVLLASVTYYKGTPGDEVVILIPKGRKCAWAAVENILKLSSIETHVYPL